MLTASASAILHWASSSLTLMYFPTGPITLPWNLEAFLPTASAIFSTLGPPKRPSLLTLLFLRVVRSRLARSRSPLWSLSCDLASSTSCLHTSSSCDFWSRSEPACCRLAASSPSVVSSSLRQDTERPCFSARALSACMSMSSLLALSFWISLFSPSTSLTHCCLESSALRRAAAASKWRFLDSDTRWLTSFSLTTKFLTSSLVCSLFSLQDARRSLAASSLRR
mmetsp:Transcript_43484/g.109003  ORF Transcript_43484/g.109003 Transcript_43484/m.109003 type:complete len:224 (-) Transcript_43484:1109-1780(-)